MNAVVNATYNAKFLLELFTRMIRVRRFEEKAAECFTKSMLAGNIHLCIGQEASVVGANAALRQTDFITCTHRGHGQILAKGATSHKMMAELFGKTTGYCKGKGGSMHAADVALGILGANGIVGAGIPIATGSALASKILGTDEVTLCFFGDSASNQGTFHESINMAAAWRLPVVYLCENNSYGVSTEIHSVTNTETIAVRAAAYDIPGMTVDGCDVLAVYEAVAKAVAHARSGKGPYLVETLVYRWQGHYCGDPAVYRPKDYLEQARNKDPIARFKTLLIQNETATADQLAQIEAEISEELEAAVKFADKSPYPEVAEAFTDVYAMDNERSVVR